MNSIINEITIYEISFAKIQFNKTEVYTPTATNQKHSISERNFYQENFFKPSLLKN